MEVRTASTAEDVARMAAEFVVRAARAAILERGRFCFALSGGSTPWKMLGLLSNDDLPWESVHVFQVDERVAPDGDPARNLTRIRTHLLDRVALPAANVHAMPVTGSSLEDSARSYALELQSLAGDPPVLDLVHLGMGGDGHTASLLPGDAVLNVNDRDVAISGLYQGHVRMTLTYPVINRARQVLWLITGAGKDQAFAQLRAADPGIPAGRVNPDRAIIMTVIPASDGR